MKYFKKNGGLKSGLCIMLLVGCGDPSAENKRSPSPNVSREKSKLQTGRLQIAGRDTQETCPAYPQSTSTICPSDHDRALYTFLCDAHKRLREYQSSPESTPVNGDLAEYNLDLSRQKVRHVPDKFFGINLVYNDVENHLHSLPALKQSTSQLRLGSIRYPGGTVSDHFRWNGTTAFDLAAFKTFRESLVTSTQSIQPYYVLSTMTHSPTDAYQWASSGPGNAAGLWEIGNELFARPGDSIYNYPNSGDFRINPDAVGNRDGLCFGRARDYISGPSRQFANQQALLVSTTPNAPCSTGRRDPNNQKTCRGDFEIFTTRFAPIDLSKEFSIKVKISDNQYETDWYKVDGDGSPASWDALSDALTDEKIYMVDPATGRIFFGNRTATGGKGSKLPANSSFTVSYTVASGSGFAEYRDQIRSATNNNAKVLSSWGGGFAPAYYGPAIEFLNLATDSNVAYDGLVMHYYPHSGSETQRTTDPLQTAVYRGLTVDRQLLNPLEKNYGPQMPEINITEYSLTEKLPDEDTSFAGPLGISAFMHKVLQKEKVVSAMMHSLIDDSSTITRTEVMDGSCSSNCSYPLLPKGRTLSLFADYFRKSDVRKLQVVSQPNFTPPASLRQELHPLPPTVREAQTSSEYRDPVFFTAANETLPEVFATAATKNGSNEVIFMVTNTSSNTRRVRLNISHDNSGLGTAVKTALYKNGSVTEQVSGHVIQLSTVDGKKVLQDQLRPYSINFYRLAAASN